SVIEHKGVRLGVCLTEFDGNRRLLDIERRRPCRNEHEIGDGDARFDQFELGRPGVDKYPLPALAYEQLDSRLRRPFRTALGSSPFRDASTSWQGSPGGRDQAAPRGGFPQRHEPKERWRACSCQRRPSGSPASPRALSAAVCALQASGTYPG